MSGTTSAFGGPADIPGTGAVTAQASLAGTSPLVWVFAATLFLSAALLFIVEPMFAKMVLPFLGGSPAVWNTCVVFFQAAMLAGYGYAHLLARWLPIRTQVAVHLTLIGVVAAALPVAVPHDWMPPADSTPIPPLLLLLLVTVGGPFFVVSSSAPLLQKWFSRTRDRAASDPYFLYAASNLGSVTALLAYPFLVEPTWTLSQQSGGWSVGYAAFCFAVLTCAVATLRWHHIPADNGARSTGLEAVAAESGWRRPFRWLLLAAVPSSLMLGTTTFLSTDVAAVPLLWIAPLTLYLLSFVVAFSSNPLVTRRAAAGLTFATMMPVVLTLVPGISLPAWLEMPLHLVAFFAFALLLHLELAQSRPHPSRLTTFYLWISAGGLLGGVFNTLVAPVVFTGVAEYPLMLLAVCALRPVRIRTGSETRRYLDALVPVVLGGVLAIVLGVLEVEAVSQYLLPIGLAVMSLLYIVAAQTRVRFTAGVAAMLLVGYLFGPGSGEVLYAERTFFGVMRVRAADGGQRHILLHGNTVHGEQVMVGERRRDPRSYYHREGPIGQLLAAMTARLHAGRIGVVGLGAGSLAAYARPGQQWTFYEIDPAVERIAASHFTYLSDCGAPCKVVLGDARLSLARTNVSYDLLVLDAFSSDAIPVHLMTREALRMYLSRLSSDGVLAFHISNRHLDLRPVLGALAADLQLTALGQLDTANDRAAGHFGSSWVVMAREPNALAALAEDERWGRPASGEDVWTDDFTNIFEALVAG